MRKIGINLYAREEIGMEAYVEMLKAMEIDVVFSCLRAPEVMHETAELLAKAGIGYDTLHAPFRQMNDIWYAGEEGERRYAELAHCIDVCTEVGAPIAVVHLSSGIKPPPPTDIGRGRFIDLVNYAAGKNVSIAFENTRMLGNLAWVLEEFGEASNAGFCWDTGHEACFTPGREYMPIFGKRLICTHIHDNDLEYDCHYLPFDGKIDFERVARQIRESGYQGALMLEVVGNRPIYNDVPPEEFMERAGKVIKRLRNMVDG